MSVSRLLLVLLAAAGFFGLSATAGIAMPVPLATLQARAERDSAAMVDLAQRLENAEGVPRDYGAAAALYCRAATAGNADGAYHLGLMRLYGRGITRQDGNARSWFERAAAAGQPHASFLLAHLSAASLADPVLCPMRPSGAAKAAPKEIVAAVERLAPRYRLDPQLVLAVIAVESGFQTGAVSPKNAKGLMQLIPETASRFGVVDSFDMEQNLQGGMAYLSWLMRTFAGDATLATAAYNAGEMAVLNYGGVPPYKETQDYVRRIKEIYQPKG